MKCTLFPTLHFRARIKREGSQQDAKVQRCTFPNAVKIEMEIKWPATLSSASEGRGFLVIWIDSSDTLPLVCTHECNRRASVHDVVLIDSGVVSESASLAAISRHPPAPEKTPMSQDVCGLRSLTHPYRWSLRRSPF